MILYSCTHMATVGIEGLSVVDYVGCTLAISVWCCGYCVAVFTVRCCLSGILQICRQFFWYSELQSCK